MAARQPRDHRWAVEAVVSAAAIALLVAAWLANAGWYDHHFPPEFLKTRVTQHQALLKARLAVAGAGLILLVWVRPWLGFVASRRGVRGLLLGVAP
jgi:hypothetical protein